MVEIGSTMEDDYCGTMPVPCPTSRAYNCALPTGMRLSPATELRSLSTTDVESEHNPPAYAQARTVRMSVAFMALRLHQASTCRNLV